MKLCLANRVGLHHINTTMATTTRFHWPKKRWNSHEFLPPKKAPFYAPLGEGILHRLFTSLHYVQLASDFARQMWHPIIKHETPAPRLLCRKVKLPEMRCWWMLFASATPQEHSHNIHRNCCNHCRHHHHHHHQQQQQQQQHQQQQEQRQE